MVLTLFLTIVWGLWPHTCAVMDLILLETWSGCVSLMAPSQELNQSAQWRVSIAMAEKAKAAINICFLN